MAKIVLSEGGNWVGKELTPGSSYFASGATWHSKKLSDIVPMGFEDIQAALLEHFNITVTVDTPQWVIKDLCSCLRSNRIGMLFCHDDRSKAAPYYLSKILPDAEPVKEAN